MSETSSRYWHLTRVARRGLRRVRDVILRMDAYRETAKYDEPGAVGDLLADLMHFCASRGISWHEVERRGRDHFEAESTPETDEMEFVHERGCKRKPLGTRKSPCSRIFPTCVHAAPCCKCDPCDAHRLGGA